MKKAKMRYQQSERFPLIERRQFHYSAHIPERRSKQDRKDALPMAKQRYSMK